MLVLTGYPLTASFRRRFEADTCAEPIYVNLAHLRRLPIIEIVRLLRSFSGQPAYIVTEDIASGAILPVLKLAAGLAGASSIFVVHPDSNHEQLSRANALASGMSLARATADGYLALSRASSELRRLLVMPAHRAKPQRHRRVLYLNANLWFGLKAGGSVAHVAGVVNGFAREGYEVELASAIEPVLVDPDVKILQLQTPQTYALPADLNYYRFHYSVVEQLSGRRHTPPTMLYQRMSIGNYSGPVLARRLGLPLIMEYNGSEVWAAQNWGGPRLRYARFATMVEDICLRHADLVVTVSQPLRDEVASRGVHPDRIICHPNGVDPVRFDPARISTSDRASLRAQHKIPTDAIVVAFVGTFGHWHGAEVFADAILRLIRRDTEWVTSHNVRFLLVGDGVRAISVRERLAGVAPFVTLTGLVEQIRAPHYLAASDILVSPHVPNPDGTRFFGSPTKLFEYMAMERAIVGSALDQIGDILDPALRASRLPQSDPQPTVAEVALVCEPGNADELAMGIRFLAERPSWRARLAANARRKVLAGYTWDHHVASILRAFDRVAHPD